MSLYEIHNIWNWIQFWILIASIHRVMHGNIFTKVWHNASSISDTSYHDIIAGDNPDRAMQRRDMQSQIFMWHSRGSTELQSAGLNCNRRLICPVGSRSTRSSKSIGTCWSLIRLFKRTLGRKKDFILALPCPIHRTFLYVLLQFEPFLCLIN